MKSRLLIVFIVLSVLFTICCEQADIEKAHEHTFGNWSVATEPTCTSIGIKKRICSGCGFEETETIPAKGHSFDSGVITKEATCKEDGTRTCTCYVCKEEIIETIPALGHSFDGIKCSRCNQEMIKPSKIGEKYTDSDGLDIVLNSFSCKELKNFTTIYKGDLVTINNYNLFSINYTLSNNSSETKIETGAFKIIYKTDSGLIESEYFSASASPLFVYQQGSWKSEFQTDDFDKLNYGETLSKNSEWLLPCNTTFLCLEYFSYSQLSDYNSTATPSDKLLNWIIEDKITPSPISNIKAIYDSESNIITVNWLNPNDDNFDYAELNYTKNGITIADNIKISNNSYSINDVFIDGNEYIFTVISVDKLGNKSIPVSVKITPTGIPEVKSINLNRYHLAYNDTDQTITVTVNIKNAYLIEDETAIIIQTKDSNGNVTNTTADFNKLSGIATATITVPSSSLNSTTNGATYTVMCKIGNYGTDTIHTARFNVSEDTIINGVNKSVKTPITKTQVALSSVSAVTRANFTFQGYNLDLSVISIQYYDSTGNAFFDEPFIVDTSSILWTSKEGQNQQNLSISLPVPQKDDLYLIRIFFDGILQPGYIELQIYDEPKFSNFEFPLVSTSKSGNTVTAKISGKNFDTPNIDFGNFIATCLNNSKIISCTCFTKKSDSIIYASFIIPDTEGEYDVTVSYGTNSISSKLITKDFSDYKIGDVLLNDGSIIRYDENNLIFTDEQKQKAIGVMYAFNDYGIPYGWLGIYNSYGQAKLKERRYVWAPSDTIGNTTSFEEIKCIRNGSSTDSAKIVTFSGDTNGSDNWEYICSIDPDGTNNSEINYPAFNYVNNYAKNFDIIEKFKKDWYMPTITELCFIYKNKEVVDSVLSSIGGTQVSKGIYWSSSQYEGYYGKAAWVIAFSDGRVLANDKYMDHNICCVRPFE